MTGIGLRQRRGSDSVYRFNLCSCTAKLDQRNEVELLIRVHRYKAYTSQHPYFITEL